MKTRIVYTKMLQDSFFAKLTPIQKLIFIYYLINDAVNIIHFYECPDRKLTFELGVAQHEIEEAKKIFSDAGKVLFYKDFVLLKNAYKYEEYTGASNENAKRKLFKQLGEDVLSFYKASAYTPVDTPLATPSISHKSETINQKEEINKEEKEVLGRYEISGNVARKIN